MSTDKEYTLSYVLTTFNKLSFLKVTMPALIAACSEDEEIVVYDGGSVDGTAEYLRELYNQKKIHQFKSEKDFGEANGYNKAMISARGILIKIISDDDAYYYPGIKLCKKLMLENPHVHLIGADGFGVNNLLQHNKFSRRYSINDFKAACLKKKPFIFCGLSIMLRKDALPLLGLWDPNFLIIDFEYTLRVTSSKAKIGWYTGLLYVNIINQLSNSGRHWKRMELEKEKLEKLYLNKKTLVSYKTKDNLKNLIRPIKHKIFPERITKPQSYEAIYKLSMQQLEEENKSIQHELLL